MLGTMTQCAAAAVFASRRAASAAAPVRGLKIGACEWSLRTKGPECFALAAQIGLDGVQVNLGSVANQLWLRRPEVQEAYRDAAKKAGVEIASIAIAEMNNIALKSEPRAAVWLCDAIDVAQALGTKVILVAQFHNGDLKGDIAGTQRTVDVLKELAPRAEQAGVILGLENYLSAEENLDIIERVGSRAVQVYYDVGNSTDKGYDIYKEIRLLKGQICELHFKDAKFLLGQGRVDFMKVRDAMDEIGFSGWGQIEAAAPHSVLTDYRANLAYLRTVFPKGSRNDR